MSGNVIKIKGGITISVNTSVKIQENIVYAKKIMFGILVSVLVRLINRSKIKSI